MVEGKQFEDASKPGVSDEDHPQVVARDEARQGVTGHHVRYVLAFGTLAVVILFLLLLSFYQSRG